MLSCDISVVANDMFLVNDVKKIYRHEMHRNDKGTRKGGYWNMWEYFVHIEVIECYSADYRMSASRESKC